MSWRSQAWRQKTAVRTARPPSSFAQAFSSCSKNWAMRARTLALRRSSIDQNNAAPLKEASRNPDGSRVVDRARSFRPYGLRHTRNRVAHRWHQSRSLSYVRGCRRAHSMAKPISCLIISLFASRKQERWQRQQIQSHQKRRSMLSSSRSQKNSSVEKPYRVGQLFAREPSSDAHALSSCSKN